MYTAVVLFVATQWYELCDVYRGSVEVEVLNEEDDALVLDLRHVVKRPKAASSLWRSLNLTQQHT